MEELHALSVSVLPVMSAALLGLCPGNLCVTSGAKLISVATWMKEEKSWCAACVAQHTQNQQGDDFPCLEAKK